LQDQPTYQGSHQAHLHSQDIDEIGNKNWNTMQLISFLISTYGFLGDLRLEGTKVERSNSLSNSSSNTHAFFIDEWKEIKVEKSNNL
jgi:hypothetical protein